MSKPILCVDFDGVIHGYTSGWKGAALIPDPPVPGALKFLRSATEHFRVAIFSSRSAEPEGVDAMRRYLREETMKIWPFSAGQPPLWLIQIEWPTTKPSAFLTIDDRALTFTGTWPQLEDLLKFKPWNKP